MKKQSPVVFHNISKEAIAILSNQVKETIAFGLVEPAEKKFTVAQLWNIQRQGKSRTQRRFL